MRNDIKYSILEKDGEELLGPTEHIPTAKDIHFSDTRYNSEEVSSAIIESRASGISSSGYVVLASYGGSAGSGRYLDIFSSGDSSQFPLPILSTSTIIEVGVRASTNSTSVVGIYKNVNGVETLIIQLPLTDSKSYNITNIYEVINTDEDLSIKVISGSIAKPSVKLVIRRGNEVP